MSGPLEGIRVIELGSIGPGPFAGMMLADHGAEVIRVERPGAYDPTEPMLRSRKLLTLDLKTDQGRADLLALVKTADALIEGLRPGKMENLGLGPDVLLAANPRLVFGRMTGWGQTGPKASLAGHDINYISLSGALHAIGPSDQPIPPLALAGDFGGGGMFLAFSVSAALLNARQSGRGQVIDCAMMEGSALLMSAFYSMLGTGRWTDARASNTIDGGTPFYGAYRTLDDKFVSIGPIEPQFYAMLINALGLGGDPDFADQWDRSTWPRRRDRLADIFLTRTRDQWCELLEDTDVCFAPVLSLSEAPYHEHAVAREAFVTLGGIIQPAPAPKYSETRLAPPVMPRWTSLEELSVENSRADL
ncbi:MAG: CaiB/BaiF CoA transferase family protein [Novosphingobium sp.]